MSFPKRHTVCPYAGSLRPFFSVQRAAGSRSVAVPQWRDALSTHDAGCTLGPPIFGPMSLTLRFLGTSASRPTVERNVSSIVVIREGETLMFDCGEGTQRQMMRYGVSFALEDIFFTHMTRPRSNQQDTPRQRSRGHERRASWQIYCVVRLCPSKAQSWIPYITICVVHSWFSFSPPPAAQARRNTPHRQRSLLTRQLVRSIRRPQPQCARCT